MLVMLATEGRKLLHCYYIIVEGETTVTSAGQEQERHRDRKTGSPTTAEHMRIGLTTNGTCLK